MISLDQLDSFHADLAQTLRKYKRMAAEEMDPQALRESAGELDDRRECYEDEVSSDNAKALLKSAREAVEKMNSGMAKLAAQLRRQASFVRAFKTTYTDNVTPGGFPDYQRDLAALDVGLDTVKELTQQLMDEVQAARRALGRRRGGSANGAARLQSSYWPDSVAAGAEYLRYPY